MSRPLPRTDVEKGIINPPSANPVKAAVKRPYPFWLGGVAASVAASITHPLDLTKVRLQTSGDKGMINSLRKTVANNGVRGLFDGLTGTLLRQMTYSMARFAAYDWAKGVVHTGPGPVPAAKMALAGSMAGGMAGIIGTPFESIMVRYDASGQGKATGEKIQLPQFDSSDGSNVPRRGVLGMDERNRAKYVPRDPHEHVAAREEIIRMDWMSDGPALHVVASVGAGTVATTVCSPADVLKSRIMNAHGAGTSSTMQVIRLANEGPMFMFKGWLPAWTRLQPTTILIFVFLEQLKKGVDSYRESGGTLL
ncbi:MAG: Mitochondrial dicarboxylate transporter [Tremellales sp. Tagirdzhanova-0007]|nr:MAG: Mitochondrial dicarboxylate transporter [Tremellales sp. Tagirdzhanova-0007]